MTTEASGRARSALSHRGGSVIFVVFGAYIALMTVVLIALGVGIEPDRYFFLLMLPVMLVGRARRYLIDWVPFLLLLFSYEFLRGLAPALGPHVHYLFSIRTDSFLFSAVPTVTLQSWLYQPGSPRIYDYLATIAYFLHFVTPLSFAFLLWLRSHAQFRRFIVAFVLLSYAALFTYVLFPAAPPWLAAQHGYLQPVHQVLADTLRSFPARLRLPGIYQVFDPNPVAAIPSLHAAYPMLMLLFALRYFGRRGLLVLPYVLWVWLSVIYMGEHYVSDVLIGAAYALGAYLLSMRVVPALASQLSALAAAQTRPVAARPADRELTRTGLLR